MQVEDHGQCEQCNKSIEWDYYLFEYLSVRLCSKECAYQMFIQCEEMKDNEESYAEFNRVLSEGEDVFWTTVE